MAEYAELISSTHKSFSIEDDIGAIARISTSLLQARQSRQKRRQESKAVIHDHSRILDQLRNTLQLTASRGGIGSGINGDGTLDHGSLMNTLDREKFTLAKAINTLEGEQANADLELQALQRKLEVEEIITPRELGHDESTVLKLSVYRDLGVTMVPEEGRFNRAVVRSTRNDDIHLIELNGSGHQANEIWKLCT